MLPKENLIVNLESSRRYIVVFDRKRGQESQSLERQIQNAVGDLPPLPAVVTKLLEVVEQPYLKATEIEELISSDAALTAKVLRIANSAYYGLSSQVESVHQAIILLGLGTIKALALGLSTFHLLQGSNKRLLIPEETLWAHALTCADLAAGIACLKQIGVSQKEAVFTGGVLHEIGLLFLLHRFGDAYQEVQARSDPERCRYEVEREVFQTDHMEVGALIAEHWQFPPSLIRIIREHHTPSLPQQEGDAQVACVALADRWLEELGLGVEAPFAIPPLPPEVEAWASLDDLSQHYLCRKALERLLETRQRLQVA